MIVFGVLLVIVGITASAQVVMVSMQSSNASLTAVIESDMATLRGFLHQAGAAGLDASLVSPTGPTREQRASLDGLLATLLAKEALLRVDLRAPDGHVLASSDASQAGSVVSPTAGFSGAAEANEVHVDMLAGDGLDVVLRVPSARTVLREYLPLSQDGKVLLVVAAYRDALPMLTALDGLRRDVVVVIITGSLLAALVLFFVFRAAQARISRQTAALVESSSRDPLTGMLNHGALVAYLADEMEHARAASRTLDVALIDLDNFRLFNDNHGHRYGDELLREVARLLREALPPEIVMGRYGPDEFLVIRPAAAEVDLAPAIEQVRAELREASVQLESTEQMPVTVSVGLSSFPAQGSSVTALLSFVARALEQARASGGDAVHSSSADADVEKAATSSFDVLQSLVFAIDTKDRYTKRHSQDVARYAVFLGTRLGLTDEALRTLHICGLLHDVGKIGIPDHLLRKPGRLSADEAAIVQQHVALGDMIVRELPDLDTVRSGIRSHHERWDGRGYLGGLRGEDIPLVARIMAVADAFSAMTTTRPYRKGMPVKEALARLGDAAGSQLEESLVREFITGLESVPDAPLPNADVPMARLWVPRLVT